MANVLVSTFTSGFRLVKGDDLNTHAAALNGTAPAAIVTAAGASTSNVAPAGLLAYNVTSTGNGADTSEDTLWTYSLPANVLSAVGKTLRIYAYGVCGANTDNKTMKLYFGSEVITTPTAATNAKNWYLQLDVIKTGASTQIVCGQGIVDTTSVTPYVTTGAETDTSAITIKMTGTAGTGTANDIVFKFGLVEILN